MVLGIPEGNAPRTLQALRFLGIVADDGQLLPPSELLRRASTEEYPEALAEIVREAYAPIFHVIDPATATEVQVSDAFRQYDPAAQRGRMVTLFLGLCEEAGIVNAKPHREPRALQTRREIRSVSAPRPSRAVASAPYVTSLADATAPSLNQHGTALFSIYEEDLALLDPAQRKSLWDALGELMLARATARQRRPDPSAWSQDFFRTYLGPQANKPEKGPEEGQ